MANVRDFEYITAIAQYGSISKASEALFLSQPTLSKFLQRVEKEVGLPLFHRVGKKFVPTPAGEIYVARSKSILELEQQMLKAQAHKAKIFLSKSGELMTYEQYARLMAQA